MDGIFTAYNKVRRCIYSSETLPQLETSRRMVKNFIKLYDADIRFENRLTRALLIRQEELFEIINKKGRIE